MLPHHHTTDSSRPGQAHRVVTPEAIAAVETIVKENRRVTVNEIAAHLDMSHGSAHHIRTSGYESWISTPYRL